MVQKNIKDSFTVISSPSSRDGSLLSLTESRSRYMLPFGGKFRVVDFTLRNSSALGAVYTILYNDIDDGLDKYVNDRDIFDDGSVAHLVRVVSSQNVSDFHDLINETGTTHYILYNGDNPSIIDFKDLTDRFIKKGSDAVIYLIDIDDRATMANKILVAKKKALQKAVKKAVRENRQAPNLVEMIVNMVINQGVNRAVYKTHYWPVNNIPDYYNVTREIVWNKEIFSLLYKDKIIKSRINTEGYAHLGKNAEVINSFMSDFCRIDGKVDNSIIYPGVVVEEKAEVKDSILLPFARVGRGARVVRSIIDESTAVSEIPNVGAYCNIGTEEEHLRNGDFPQSIFSSITLLGKNCHVPDRLTIGGACYIASEAADEAFGKSRIIHDGVSVN
ncbi:MAG: hypothetical protein LBT84_08105 [Spirochaetia bacterium]|jgi:glucose-1-phosphate adenylyltransferase|nr:hypothetical protein [Spirochaetia bacterium]